MQPNVSPFTPNGSSAHDQVHLRRAFLVIAAAWTLAIGVGLGWDLRHDRRVVVALARQGAVTAWNKDALYRLWNSRHGGVYVPATSDTPPNPALQFVPERDVKTPSGRLLTLVNHAYMIRQVYEMDENGPEGHLVAFHPLNPKNSPDSWEAEALHSFSARQSEADAVVKMHGQGHFRLMRPLVLGPACVACHAAQGYKEGDLYGGMSIAVDMAPYEAEARAAMVATSVVYAVFCGLGLGGVFLAWRPLRDITRERRQTLTSLSAALSAKEVLLQEVHHRVKNNLQIISSLLSMQAQSVPEEAQRALDDSQRRVRCMALVHEQLYSRELPDELDFAEYATSLTSDLLAAYSIDSERVRLRLELDPVVLRVGQATPCGLILNELVTNSVKYGFPEGRPGEILVAVHCRDGRVSVRVADDGIGLPPGFDWRQSTSLGLRIVDILTLQLNGTLDCNPGGGADFTLTFPKS